MLRKIGLTHHACIITTKNKWMTLSDSVRIKIQVGENVHHVLRGSHFDSLRIMFLINVIFTTVTRKKEQQNFYEKPVLSKLR